MSVNNYKYTCPGCGHEEQQAEGMYLFSDKCYYMLQCPECKKVESYQLTEEEYYLKTFPICCGVRMKEWSKTCPVCDIKMDEKLLYSDTI